MLHNQHSSVNSQLDRLERISNQISLLISNNDYERISHLDRMRKKIITVGVAFSFQKHHNLPVNKKDFKLDYIITENGFIK